MLDDLTNFFNDFDHNTASKHLIDTFVDHNHDKNITIQTTYQRQFLISLGFGSTKMNHILKIC